MKRFVLTLMTAWCVALTGHAQLFADNIADSTLHRSTLYVTGDNQLQLADLAPIPPRTGMTDGDLVWTIIAVVIALALCYYCMRKYRRRK